MIFLHSVPLDNQNHQIKNQTSFRTIKQHDNSHFPNHSEMRKKIENYSFALNNLIGKGYSSTVYKGTDDLTGQEVAIKVIELRSLKDQTSKNMLYTEIECFREVQHPNVLKYHNSFFTSNNCYIITEYCPGSDLSKIMKSQGKIPEAEAGKLFLQIFQGYKAFYEAGYIHRDLKPANIFVGKDGQLKLADFGFSKKRTLVDRQIYNVGTPIYMPRQSLAANIYNQKTDLWALGITLYEMVYGEVPFKGRTEQELRFNIEKGIIHFYEHVPASSQLKDFITQSLLNDSLQRMGVKEMEKHQWLRSQRPIQQKQVESPEKVLQEHNLRTSLPQNSILNNRSREYFEPKQLKENRDGRRSVSTMQKLKLCMPKKGSYIFKPGRQVLTDHTNRTINRTLPQSDKENKHENKQELRTARQTAKPSRRSSNLKCIEKVVILINYFRYLYRLLEKINQNQAVFTCNLLKGILKEASKALTDRVSSIFSKHLDCVNNKLNKFQLDSEQWLSFVTSDRWKMYDFVIHKYQSKYAQLLSQAEKYEEIWESASKLFCLLWQPQSNSLLDTLLVREKYLYMEMLGLVGHLCVLDRTIKEEGWESFCEHYNNETILLESYSINLDTYPEMVHRLNDLYQSITQENL